jgi:hypothetical protein
VITFFRNLNLLTEEELSMIYDLPKRKNPNTMVEKSRSLGSSWEIINSD